MLMTLKTGAFELTVEGIHSISEILQVSPWVAQYMDGAVNMVLRRIMPEEKLYLYRSCGSDLIEMCRLFFSHSYKEPLT